MNASDEDRDVLEFTWKEGDSVLGTGPTLEYSKLGEGEHTVTVDDGTGTVEGGTTVWVRDEKYINGTGILPSLLIIAILVLVISTVIWYRQRRGAGSSP